MLNRSTIMRRAWQTYHAERRTGRPFDRALFAASLRAAWAEAKRRAVYLRERIEGPKPIVVSLPRYASELDRMISATSYLPGHMSQTRAIAEIRARNA